MPLSRASLVNDDLSRRLDARLDNRLLHNDERPVAVALSGGGDSVALLAMVCDWARRSGRRVLALTVDHQLSPDGPSWSREAQRQALALGADWAGLVWSAPKPVTGLSAAARGARHRLIAQAAREAGARVVLFAHTADDIAEGLWMRSQGSTLGDLREWSPSPVWPQGRGLMLMRPLLGERRESLRSWLQRRRLGWIEDPANGDARFGRARARAALLRIGDVVTQAPDPAVSGRESSSGAGVVADAYGLVAVSRHAPERVLATVMVCAGGGATLPRRDPLMRIAHRLATAETFTSVLCGARLSAIEDAVVISREAGEMVRRPVSPLTLETGTTSVWDGRFEIKAGDHAGTVHAASGYFSRLSAEDRATLKGLPPAARLTMPVLIRDRTDAPVLAWRSARVRCLVNERLALALDQTTHEGHLTSAADGETPASLLFRDARTQDRHGTLPPGPPRTA